MFDAFLVVIAAALACFALWAWVKFGSPGGRAHGQGRAAAPEADFSRTGQSPPAP